VFYLTALNELSTTRAQPGARISWHQIRDYAAFHGVKDFEGFSKVIQSLDSYIMEKVREPSNG
jgi:hypothetical protein